MGCQCYEYIGFAFVWACVAWIGYKLGKGLWTSWLGSSLGFGFKWQPGKDSWAVITGATDGIGLEYASELARKGYSLLLISRSNQKLFNVKEKIQSTASKCNEIRTLTIDFSKRDVYGQIEQEISKLKGKVDVLINNVGVSYCTPEYFGSLSSTNADDFSDTLINVNIVSCTRMCQIVLPRMEEQRRGLIINISSLSASYPTPLLSVYAASKIFVDFLSRGIAVEYANKGIIIQSVLPSYVATNMSKIRKPTLLAPTPNTFVKSALKTVGLEGRTYGYWAHKIEGFVYDNIIVPLVGVARFSKLAFGNLSKIRASYYRKYKSQ